MSKYIWELRLYFFVVFYFAMFDSSIRYLFLIVIVLVALRIAMDTKTYKRLRK